jgi:hypothetical protein
MIPLGVRTDQKGRITLSFSGMENFENMNIYLHDTKENRIVNLSETDEYDFMKYEESLYIENRFFLSFEDLTGINNLQNNGFSVMNPEQGTIQILSNNGQVLENLEIIDYQGRTIAREENIGQTVYRYQTSAPGVYMVKIMGETKKIIVK